MLIRRREIYFARIRIISSCIKEKLHGRFSIADSLMVFPKYAVPGVSPETLRFQGGDLRFTVGFSVRAEPAQ